MTILEKALEHLKQDEFEEALQLVLHQPDEFAHEDRKRIANYCMSSNTDLAKECFTISKVKNDADMMKYAFQHTKLTTNNKLIYAIELGLDAVVEKLALQATNLEFAIYKCMILQKDELAKKLADISKAM
jgi:hypothetical protein